MPNTATEVQFRKEDMRVRADITSVDEENRQFEATLITETPVRKRDYSSWQMVNEILECTPDAVDLTRVNEGVAPFLNSHSTWSASSGIGVIERAWIESNTVKIRVRMSTRPDDPELEGIWHDIKTGIRKAVSGGYTVQVYEITRHEEDGKSDDYRATKWTLMEGSSVLIPADAYAGVRSEDKGDLPQTDLVTVRSIENRQNREEMPGADGGNPTPVPTPAPVPAPDLDKIRAEARDEAIASERARVQEIQETRNLFEGKGVQMPDGFWKKAVDDNMTPDQVRSSAQAEWAKADPNEGSTGGAPKVGADREKFQERMTDALDLRLNGSVAEKDMTPEQLDGAREFRGLSPMRMATLFAEKEDGHNSFDSNEKIAKRALKLGEFSYNQRAHSTTDLPLLLTSTLNRSIRREYQYQTKTWEMWTNQTSASDFRPITRGSMGDLPELQKVVEGGEYTSGGVTDEGEQISIAKYGRMMPISWESFVNDDLSALSRIPGRWARQLDKLHNTLAYNELLNNSNLQDGVALFHADHLNLATASALDVTNLGAMFKLLRNQKSIPDSEGNSEFLNLTGRYLICGPNLELASLQLLKENIVATTSSNTNPYRGRLTTLVDPLITDNRWYVIEDPRLIDTVEMRFLNGERYTIERVWNHRTDCWEFKIRSVAGGKAIDFRGMYRNPGV